MFQEIQLTTNEIKARLKEISEEMGELPSRPETGQTRLPSDDPNFKKLYHDLNISFLEARKGKRNTRDEQMFEECLAENIYRLALDIYFGFYEPTAGIAFVNNPENGVPREIYAAPFRDRVVHHYIFHKVNPWWDSRLIFDSASCRKKKGSLFAIKRAEKHLRAASKNFSKDVVVFRGDIWGFFMSLSREKILERALWGLKRQFKGRENCFDCQILEFLWTKVLLQDPTTTVRYRGKKSDWNILPETKILSKQPVGQGIVIGNLTSQLISNIFLDLLDRFITQVLGYKYYGRYVDDFYIIVPRKKLKQLKKDLVLIKEFMNNRLKLKLHPKKCKIIYDINREGMEFLGAVIYPRRVVPSKKFKKNFNLAVQGFLKGERSVESVRSYEALTVHFNAYKMVEKIYKRYGLDLDERFTQRPDWAKRRYKGRK